MPKADRSDPEKGPEPAHDGDRKQQEQQQQQQQQRQDDGQAPLDAFFKEVAHIKGLHESIRRYLSDLQDKHARSKSITRSDLLKRAHSAPNLPSGTRCSSSLCVSRNQWVGLCCLCS